MPWVHCIDRSGSCVALQLPAGQSLMRGLKAAGHDEILALCGGCASCGTCHVYVDDEWLASLPAMGTDEAETLGFSDWRRPNSRLSCQIPLTEALDGLIVTIAPED